MLNKESFELFTYKCSEFKLNQSRSSLFMVSALKPERLPSKREKEFDRVSRYPMAWYLAKWKLKVQNFALEYVKQHNG